MRVVVFDRPGTTSARDGADVTTSRDVGPAAINNATLDGQPLSFRSETGLFIDAETSSHWTILGQAVAGPVLGTHLDSIDHTTPFWFAMVAFKSTMRIYRKTRG